MTAPEAPESLGSATTAAPEFRLAPLARILKSPTNPRKRRDAAADAELAASVKAHGILQPLLVRRWQVGMALPKGACFGDMTDHFELIAGERRWGAAAPPVPAAPTLSSIPAWPFPKKGQP